MQPSTARIALLAGVAAASAACGAKPSGNGLPDDAFSSNDVSVVDTNSLGDAYDGSNGPFDAADGGDGGSDANGSDGGPDPDAAQTGDTSLLCNAHTWNVAVPAMGTALMAYRAKGYLFAASGLTWTVIENGGATVASIPLPAGITAMQSVTAEIAPSGRPFVTFSSAGQRYGAFFDGAAFVGVTAIDQAQPGNAHADAAERIYALTPSGLTEYAPGAAPLIRGAFPYPSTHGWTVAADGTVYVLRSILRPSTIHPGDQANELRAIRLRPGALAWTDEVPIGSNEGWGFGVVRIAGARDGSLHIAYTTGPIAIYFRSTNGQTWVTENLTSFAEKATMVDPAGPGVDEVKGGLYAIAAQDYEHASVTLTYNQGSFSTTSYYYLRRCPPFDMTFPAWPAERLSMTPTAFAPTPVAVDERGRVSILTPGGVRQDVP